MARVALPVADGPAVRRYARTLLRRHTRQMARVVGVHGAAALAGLGAPVLLGRLTDGITHGTTTSAIDRIALGLLVFVVVQAVLTRFAAFASARMGEQVL